MKKKLKKYLAKSTVEVFKQNHYLVKGILYHSLVNDTYFIEIDRCNDLRFHLNDVSFIQPANPETKTITRIFLKV